MNTLDFIINKYGGNKKDKVITLSISRWSSLIKIFRNLGFTVGAEIGTASGRYAKVLLEDVPNLRLYCVDLWEVYPEYTDTISKEKIDKMYLDARKRLLPYKALIVRDTSMNAVKRFADESLDFVFIDANHDYKFVKEDIREWSKKVKKGGIVSGHDYRNLHREIDYGYGVKKAVDEWVKEKKIHPLIILNKEQNYNCDTWLYVKT